MGEPQRRCSSCGESYAGAVIFCPRDGSALLARGADAGPDPYLGQIVHGTFRIDALIGAGAMGRVYRAHQQGVERNVALKIMHRNLATNPELRSRFQREARIAGLLSHPNLVSVLLLSELELDGVQVPWLALEYLDGLSLRSAILAQGALPVDRALHILVQIADAVAEAHQHGIVHRDLKPENVMLIHRAGDPDFVKVLDFGVARVESQTAGHGPSVATNAGAIFGSARYVAPECAAGEASSPASDVYALATIGYECLTGKTPFDGENAVQILLQQQQRAVPPLREQNPTIPSAIERLITRNLAKAPESRSADARVFARELLSAARQAGVDPGLASHTRRGHALLPASLAASDEPLTPTRSRVRSTGAPLAEGSLRRTLFVLLCFALGAGAAFGIATQLGAFGERTRPSAVTPKVGVP